MWVSVTVLLLFYRYLSSGGVVLVVWVRSCVVTNDQDWDWLLQISPYVTTALHSFYSRYYLDTVQGYQATIMCSMSEYVSVILSQNPKHTRAPQACVTLCCAIMLSKRPTSKWPVPVSRISGMKIKRKFYKSELILLLLTVLLELRLTWCWAGSRTRTAVVLKTSVGGGVVDDWL